MKKIDVSISYDKAEEQELTPEERSLLDAARKATYRSYSPYSGFSVGAAVLLDDGTIVEGSNQENSSYPQGMCAERTALFYTGSRYPDKKILALCIAARGTDGSFTTLPVTPCGGCRQALLESECRQKSPIKVLLYGIDEIYVISSAQQLLPLAFQL
jgi:cytidine deaminase